MAIAICPGGNEIKGVPPGGPDPPPGYDGPWAIVLPEVDCETECLDTITSIDVTISGPGDLTSRRPLCKEDMHLNLGVYHLYREPTNCGTCTPAATFGVDLKSQTCDEEACMDCENCGFLIYKEWAGDDDTYASYTCVSRIEVRICCLGNQLVGQVCLIYADCGYGEPTLGCCNDGPPDLLEHVASMAVNGYICGPTLEGQKTFEWETGDANGCGTPAEQTMTVTVDLFFD
jgi:hypothetical protein